MSFFYSNGVAIHPEPAVVNFAGELLKFAAGAGAEVRTVIISIMQIISSCELSFIVFNLYSLTKYIYR